LDLGKMKELELAMIIQRRRLKGLSGGLSAASEE
jgi:hypothetical protein